MSWTEQQERLLRAAQAVVNGANEYEEARDGERVTTIDPEALADLKAIVQEINDDAVKLIKVGPGEGDFYWINKAEGNYRCNICGFQYHDGDPVAHCNLQHGRAPITEGKR